MSDRVWTGLGDQQLVHGVLDRVGAAYGYATKAGAHMWVATIAHQLGETALDRIDGKDPEPLLLDAESLLMAPVVVCYVCEQAYERRLRRRACPGEPR